MKKKGMGVTLGVLVIAFLAWMGITTAPEFKRYLRIRSM
jgi:hypothetical protein